MTSATITHPYLTSLQDIAHLFVLSEMARKRYGHFSPEFDTSVTTDQTQTEVLSLPVLILEPGALPPTLEALAKKYRPLIDRVMARLSEAERRESNLHLKADYRQSWICLSFANRGLADPFVQASYQMYGVHPDKVWARIVADRKERLGAEYYEWYSSDDMPRPDVPRFYPTTAHRADGASSISWDERVGPVPQDKEAS